jgi:N-methylhydantoinase B/oxoprolinase/acetone carboxylase alpha subunit
MSATTLDPVTFEVIRHRLWAINDEQARMGARLSGSPIVYEGYDFNAALITGDGRGLYTGVYILQHGATIDEFVRQVLGAWDADDIREGDMFFTNDPWWGALHANDGIVAMPVFHDGEIVLWSGMVMHDNDVGSPVPSSFVTNSRDRFGEAPLFPAVKLAVDFKPLADIERLYLRNTRTPEHNALNLRARVAALRTTYERVTELIDQYGVDAFRAAQEAILEYVERVVRRRLTEIPDGEWSAQIYVDHDGHSDAVYPIKVRLTKRGDHLVCDFTGTAEQAPGPINCARPAMEGAAFGVMLTYLCYDLPWAIGGLRPLMEFVSEPGTLNNAVSPAAVSMGSTMGTLTTQDAVASAFSKMLLSSDKHGSEASGSWTPGVSGAFVIGVDRNGVPCFAIAPDCFGGGGGARTFTDGVDTGGIYHSMASRTGNVETLESRGGLLELYRREMRDSGGPGRFRGGVGLEEAYVPHKVAGPAVCNTWATGVVAPGGRGLSGGAPGASAAHVVVRGSNLWALLAAGELPLDHERLESAAVDVQAAKDLTMLGEDDVRYGVIPGGAGFGDPLRRDPAAVARDVAGRLVSEETARSIYGVALAGGGVDVAATAALRDELRAARLRDAKPAGPAAPDAERLEGGTVLHPVSDSVEAVERDGERALRCTVCSRRLCAYDEDHKRAAVMRELPLTAAGPGHKLCDLDRFVLREFYCPGCGTGLATDVQAKDEPILDESRFFAPPPAEAG